MVVVLLVTARAHRVVGSAHHCGFAAFMLIGEFPTGSLAELFVLNDRRADTQCAATNLLSIKPAIAALVRSTVGQGQLEDTQGYQEYETRTVKLHFYKLD